MVHRILRRKNYPADLTDEQWAILEPMIPPAKQSNGGGCPRTVDMREVLNTLCYTYCISQRNFRGGIHLAVYLYPAAHSAT